MTAPDYRTPSRTDESGLTDDVREHGKDVGQHAKSAAVDVKDSATDRARDVAAEAKNQARDLVAEGRSTLNQHANTQVGRLGDTLRQVADELHRMAESADSGGTAGPLVRELADRTDGLAQHVQGREAMDLVDDLRSFARRKPGAFLAGAAALGFVAGRLGRGLKDAQSDSGTQTGMRSPAGWAGEPYPAHGYPTGPVGTGQPVGGTAGLGAGTGVESAGGYATGAGYETGAGYGTTGRTGDAYGTGGYGAGTSGYVPVEGEETQALPPVTPEGGDRYGA